MAVESLEQVAHQAGIPIDLGERLLVSMTPDQDLGQGESCLGMGGVQREARSQGSGSLVVPAVLSEQ